MIFIFIVIKCNLYSDSPHISSLLKYIYIYSQTGHNTISFMCIQKKKKK